MSLKLEKSCFFFSKLNTILYIRVKLRKYNLKRGKFGNNLPKGGKTQKKG